MRRILVLFIVLVLALSGCQFFNFSPLKSTPTPTIPTQLPSEEINICLGYEPESLYIYNFASQAANDVASLIYAGPFKLVNGQHQPVILENLPSFANGDARFTPIGVNPGDPVVNTEGDLVNLHEGVQVFPTGCTSPDCSITYDGSSPLQMDQITAVFKLKPGILWSDGLQITAKDSVFSYRMASDPVTPVSKLYIDQTYSYTATGDFSLEWVSQPGLVTDEFWNYFWTPLSEHAWGESSADDLLSSHEANFNPIGWGPFMVEEWVQGDHLQLVKNPNYFRSNEGFPKADILNIKFINYQDVENIGQLANGRCDIISGTLVNRLNLGTIVPENFGFNLITKESNQFEMLALGIKPASYDDYYYPFGVDRPDIFSDVRTRRAIAYCIDRDTIVNKLLQGSAVATDSMLPSTNPVMATAQITRYNYDPTTGAALLAAAGWQDIDRNPATPLMHMGNAVIPYGTPLSLNLLVSNSTLQSEIAAEISSDLATCGIEAKIEQIPTDELYLPGPDGKVFGRQFDLALLQWDTGDDFNCRMFESTEIPTDANNWLGEITGGANFYGYSNAQFDSECQVFESAGFDETLKMNAINYLLKTINDELPFIPLFRYKDALMVSEDLCIPDTTTSESDLFVTLESVYVGGNCE